MGYYIICNVIIDVYYIKYVCVINIYVFVYFEFIFVVFVFVVISRILKYIIVDVN